MRNAALAKVAARHDIDVAARLLDRALRRAAIRRRR
jgi:hypothetical protein